MRHSNFKSVSIRPFIGSYNFEQSKAFYRYIGCEEIVINEKLVHYSLNKMLSFYLQDYIVKDWIDNSMIFVEVDNVEKCYEYLKNLDVNREYKTAKLSELTPFDWGTEIFLHDPSGVLWHFCEFKNKQR